MRFGSNALANVLTGGSSIIFQLGVTAMATRCFNAETFTTWTLALSMASLTPLFAVNLSAVVTRQLIPLPVGSQEAAVVITAARRLGYGLAAAALLIISVVALGLHRASLHLASTGTGTFMIAVLLLTISQVWQITIQPNLGWHYAREQNWPVVGALVLVRTSALMAMWIATRLVTGDLQAIALCLAMGHWFGVAVTQTKSFRPKTARCDAGPKLKRQMVETAHLLRWFTIWSLGMAAIQYGLPQFMSVLGAAHYNAFYLAYSLNLVLTGVVGAIGSAMLAPLARTIATGDVKAMVRALTYLPIILALGLVATLVGLRLAMPFLVTYWSRGIAPAGDVNSYLFLIGFQTIARSLCVAFSIVMASRATALRLVGPVLLELAVVLFVAVPIGGFIGARAFLWALAGAGVIAAIGTALVGMRVAGLNRTEQRTVMTCFIATEVAALSAWYMLATHCFRS
jgi:hypothetical protein